jgi:LCP family protein required for cell wall assembly
MTTPTNARPTFFKRIGAGFSRLDRLTKIFLIAFVVAGAGTGAVAFGYVRQLVESSPSHSLPGLAIHEDTTTAEGEVVAPNAENIYNYTTPEGWDGASRVNILVMGLDARDWETGQGSPRTDTMMVLTFDPVTRTAGMLSIPRDLWVDIPGYGHERINNAYSFGERDRLPGGGAGLAMQTVEQLLGITINYYAQIDFRAFVRFIDIIGGVKIDIPSDIRVQVIGEDGTTLIPSGRQVLNGDLALGYARYRHCAQGQNNSERCAEDEGDIDRGRRQQEVILAIRQQLARNDVRALVLNNLTQVYDAIASGINTNMSVQDALSLGWAVKDIDLGSIERAVIGPNACLVEACVGDDYVDEATSPDGFSILKPITVNIRIIRDQVFSSGSSRSPLALTSQDVDLMKMEAANVMVNNGSGNGGIADTTRAYLESQGMIIVSTGNADAVDGTTIIDYTGNPYTVQYLANLMSVNSSHIFNRYDPNSTVDVEIIIGPEWAVP